MYFVPVSLGWPSGPLDEQPLGHLPTTECSPETARKFYGGCSESVDLIYLEPPSNANAK